jgi:hypothetical protein
MGQGDDDGKGYGGGAVTKGCKMIDIEWIDLTSAETPSLDKSLGSEIAFGTGGDGPFVPLPQSPEKHSASPQLQANVDGGAHPNVLVPELR